MADRFKTDGSSPDRSTDHFYSPYVSRDIFPLGTNSFSMLVGAFHYYITVRKSSAGVALPADSVGDGYFLVEPELTCRGRHRSVDSVVCQTVLSKLMGPLDTWEVCWGLSTLAVPSSHGSLLAISSNHGV